jgi:transcription elongation factor Elf1
MKLKIEFKCPYCRHLNEISLNFDESYKKLLAYCYMEEGGCDGEVVLNCQVKIDTEVRKIEGEGHENSTTL